MYGALGKMLFKKKLFFNIILILQLGVSLTVANVLLGGFNEIYRAYNFTENYSGGTSFFSPMRIDGEVVSDIDHARLDGASVELLPKTVETRTVNVLCYGRETAEGLRSQLRRGEWQIDSSSGGTADTIIDCVVIGNGYGIGDEFSASVGGRSFNFRVSGSLGMHATVISPSRRSAEMTADVLFYEYNANINGTAVICSSDALADAAGTYGNALVFGATDESAEYLGSVGWLTSMSEIRENSDAAARDTMRVFLPLAICFGLIGAVTAVGMACLNLLANKKVFDVYFICGMRRSDAFLINLAYMRYVARGVAVTVIALLALSALVGIIDGDNFRLGINNLLLSLAAPILISLAASALTLTVLKPEDISKK